MMYRFVLFIWIITLGFQLTNCEKESNSPTPMSLPEMPANAPTSFDSIVYQLKNNYALLPEEMISVSQDSLTLAEYAGPVDRYRHGILGDQIEAEQLVVFQNDQFYQITLSNSYVFEDLRPRLADVDQDGNLEFIAIRSHLNEGAGIVIYKVVDNALKEWALVPEIGTPNRWLNPVAIEDLNQDGTIDLAWIQTPHIGGILKVASIKPGTLEVLDEIRGYSNHGIGSRNLCLSVVTQESGQKLTYVPTQNREQIVGFSLSNNQWTQEVQMMLSIDFNQPLPNQFEFTNLIMSENNCIE